MNNVGAKVDADSNAEFINSINDVCQKEKAPFTCFGTFLSLSCCLIIVLAFDCLDVNALWSLFLAFFCYLIICKLPDDDDVHAGDVDGEPPPVHKPANIETAEKNAPARAKDIHC